jgi:gamma-glutamylcyclotransferase (GGCT)/AIG2-like uncharacterized protein YtfP
LINKASPFWTGFIRWIEVILVEMEVHMEHKKLVFVYGTLKSGYHNNRLLEEEEFVGEAVTKPLYRLWDVGAFPGLTEDFENGKAIQGELWRVSPECVVRLDRLEGTPYLYRREVLQIEGVTEEVQGYIFNRDYSRLEECSPVWEG